MCEILWDFYVYLDHMISARRPDIIIDKAVSNVIMVHVDVSIPADKNISTMEEEKFSKYQDLRVELERIWKKKTKMVPVVIGALGSISKRLGRFFGVIGH